MKYKKDHNFDGWPIVDTEKMISLDKDELVNRLNHYHGLISEAAEYLSINNQTQINSGSVLHTKFLDAAKD